jgi:UTP--glucose-1-phosphate uridylyltransferase
VLVQNERGVLSTKDLGVSISHEAADNQEKSGGPVLFNCATGLFDLSYLNQNLERIIAHLPLRISKQDKDIGQYLQARASDLGSDGIDGGCDDLWHRQIP